MSTADNESMQGTPVQGGTSSKFLSDKLAEARLTYVWDWWKFHAKQRTEMFYFFLIFTGILANAYVALLKDEEGQPGIAISLGFFGAIASVGFLLLDIRNRTQLERATDILCRIESNQLCDQGEPLGLADIGGSPIFKHKFVFRTIEVIVGLGWVLIIIQNLMMV